MIEVCSAVIVRGDRILLTQRPFDKDYPYTWECPGGKVIGAELYYETLQRELIEEIGVEITAVRSIPVARGTVTDSIKITFYPVMLVPTGPTRNPYPWEGQGIGWFTVDEMCGLTLTPGNKMFQDQISAYVKGYASATVGMIPGLAADLIRRVIADISKPPPEEVECYRCKSPTEKEAAGPPEAPLCPECCAESTSSH